MESACLRAGWGTRAGLPRAVRRRATTTSSSAIPLALLGPSTSASRKPTTARSAHASASSDDVSGVSGSTAAMDATDANGSAAQNNAIANGSARNGGVPSYADWWTRADAVAAARVAAEKDFDCDEYELEQALSLIHI